MMTSKRSLIGVAVLFAIAATGACGSDASAPPSTPSAGAPAAHAGAGGAPASGGGGATSAGAPAAGAPAAGATSAGAAGSATAGAGGASGGASGGAGGASGGAGGGSAGAGGGSAGASQTFAAVKTLIGMSCGTGNCHNKNSGQLDFQGTTDLYGLLTKPIATTVPHCDGSTLAVSKDTNSLLLRIVKGGTMCVQGGAMKTVAQMPDNCAQGNKCFTATQTKVFSDWIDAGVPQ